jgi:hypothetical protein
MVDLSAETILSLTQAARRLPPGRGGRPVSLSCILRWVIDGMRRPSGDTIRLEALRLGGRWVTSVQALQRFAERLTPNPDCITSKTPRTQTARRAASERAADELSRVGI